MKTLHLLLFFTFLLLFFSSCERRPYAHEEKALAKVRRICNQYYTHTSVEEAKKIFSFLEDEFNGPGYYITPVRGIESPEKRLFDSLYRYEWVQTIRYRDTLNIEYYYFISKWKDGYHEISVEIDANKRHLTEEDYEFTSFPDLYATYPLEAYMSNMNDQKESHLKAAIQKMESMKLELLLRKELREIYK